MIRSFGCFGVVAAGILTLASTVARAHDYQVGSIKIGHPWTRMPPAAAKVAGGFMTLTNTGTAPDTLIGGTLVNASRFEVHEMSVTDGVMRMRQLQPGLVINPGETVALKPGSYHVMFIDLKSVPEAAKRLKGTLVFEKAGAVEVEYTVEPAGAGTSGGHDHGEAEKTGNTKTGNTKTGKGAGSGSGSGSGSGAVKNANQ